MPYKDPAYKKPKEKLISLFPETGLQLHCPNCNHDIKAENVNIDKAIAKCTECHTVFSFEHELKSFRRRPEIFMPEGIEMLELRSELDIRYKWRQANVLSGFLMFFTIFWNVLLLPFVITAVMTGQYLILLATSFHILIGVGLLYHVITNLFNTTYITVDNYNLSIEHRPFKIPFFYADRYIDINDINQLYVKKYVASQSKGGNFKSYAYALYAKVAGAKDVRLLKGIKNQEKAQYIEQEIERYLQIPDKMVEEETT